MGPMVTAVVVPAVRLTVCQSMDDVTVALTRVPSAPVWATPRLASPPWSSFSTGPWLVAEKRSLRLAPTLAVTTGRTASSSASRP